MYQRINIMYQYVLNYTYMFISTQISKTNGEQPHQWIFGSGTILIFLHYFQKFYPRKLNSFDDDCIRREAMRRIEKDLMIRLEDLQTFVSEKLEKEVSKDLVQQSLHRSGFRYVVCDAGTLIIGFQRSILFLGLHPVITQRAANARPE